jgi:hypothetical protein
MYSKKEQKADLLLQLKSEWLSCNCVDLPPVISVESAGVYIPIWKNEILLAAVHKSPCRTGRNTNVVEPLGFRNKCAVA